MTANHQTLVKLNDILHEQARHDSLSGVFLYLVHICSDSIDWIGCTATIPLI